MKNKLFTKLVLSSMAVGLAMNQGMANPQGGTVAAGDATITGEGTTVTTILQTSPTAIINWQDFSIGLGELTRFIQPGADAAVLNRVLSGSPSQLLGTLQANGQVYLINPNGILVGPSGQINAATFVGSTLDVADGAFLSGGNMQFLGSTTAGVENLGTINALGGDIFLFGHTVKNSGTLNASGTAGLAAGMSIELRQQGNERIGVLLGNSAAPTETGVDNQGLVQATSVEINAAGGNIYAVAINNGGTVRAQPTLVMEGGKLVLKSEGGTVINSGTLDASNADGKGGDIVVAGDKVSLRDGSVVDASGSTGGGSVKIGGGFQGNDASVVNASKTFVSAGASILADATTVGDGGTVIVWSDEVTRFGGSISAKGGALGGNGGFAEVSGKSLLFSGTVDLTAAAGNIGTLLLDPVQIQIAATDFNSPVSDFDEFADSAASPAVFANTTINALLNGANVTLQANSDIYVDNPINAAGVGDLTLQAGRSVFINADITLNGSFSATANDTAALAGNRAIAPFADGGITMGGTVTINTSAANGNITLNVLTGPGGGFQSGDITVNNLNAGAGHVFLNNAGATAGSDVLMANGTAVITAGSVALNAANGNIGSGATPVRLASTIAEASASGTVDIFATGALQIGGASLGSLTGITSGGALHVTAQGNITQTELITASAASTFTIDTANPADVLLASAANDFGGAITVDEANAGVVRDIAIRNVNATPAYPTFTIAGTIRNLTLVFDNADLTLPVTTITGNLVATSGTGLIAQSGTLTVPGTTTLSANSTITLTDAANDFTGAVAATSGGNASLTDVNAIVLGASSVGGDLVVNAGTGITQTGVLTITGTSSFTDTGANDDIVLTQANLFTGAVSANGNNVSITDANGLILGNVTVGGDLTVLASLGDITTDAASTGIIVTGNSSFTANGAGASILLGDTDNNFTGNVSIAGAGGLANVTIFDATALVLNSVTVTGNLTVTATGITQSGVITVGGTTTLNGGAAAINLATQNNDFNTVTASNTSDLSLNDINDIVLGAITLTGNLTVNSGLTGAGVTGSISQTGVLDIDGTSAFNVSAANLSDVLLASQANDFTGAVTITEVGAGNIRDIELRNVSGTAAVPVFPTGLRNLTLIFNNTSIDLSATTLTGTLTVTAGGAITDNGALVVAGNTTLTAGAANDITLNTAGNDFNTVSVVSGNNVTLVDADDIDLGASTISGTLSVTANGAITDSGNVTVVGTTTLSAGVANAITLDSTGNDFNTVAVTIAGNVTLVDTDNIDLGASTMLGSLSVTANGAITDSGNVLVLGGSTTLAAGVANNITLDQAGNNFSSVVITSGNNVTLVDVNAIDLGASTVTGNLNVTAAATITDSGNVTVGGTTTLSAGAVITLDQAGNDFNTVVITTGNNVTLVDTDNIDLGASTVTGTLNVTANGAITDSGNVTVTGTTTLAAGAANDITLNSAGNDFNTVLITTGNNVTLVDTDDIDLGASTISGTLSVTANGAITDSGNVTVAGATATFAAGAANDITLNSAGNDFNTVVITSGNNVTLVDTDNIDLGASTISGTLSVTANGAITDSGNVTVAGATATFAAGAANDITLNSAGNDFNTVVITTGNNVTLVDTDNIDLGASTISGTLSVTANGAITDSGTITVAGSTTLTAGAFDITLNDAANDFNAVTVVSGANVTIIDADDITFSASATLTSVAVTGTAITLPAGITTSGAQTYTGAVLIGSDMTLSSTGGGNLTFSSTINSTTGNSFDLALVTDGSVSIGSAVGGVDHLDVLDIRADAITFTAITTDTSVTLRPFTAGTAIGVGDAGQTFNITDAELDAITSPLVTIGDSTAGAITAATTESITIGYGITLVNNSSVTFGANTFSTTGNLTVNANGAITDASGATISVTGTANFNAGAANNIVLGDNGGDTVDFGKLTVTGNNVTITEDSGTQFVGTSTVGNNLIITAANGIGNDDGTVISVTGNANFTETGGANLSLGTATGDDVNFGSVTLVGAGQVFVVEDSSLELAGVNSSGANFTLGSNSTITDANGVSLTVGAFASFNNLGVADITLGDNAGDIINFSTGLNGGVGFKGDNVSITADSAILLNTATENLANGDLVLISSGDITDAAATGLTVVGNASFNANGGANNITLGDNGGDTVHFGSLTVVGNNVVITEDSSTLLTGVNTVNGFLTLTSASDITDASGVTLNVTGLANFNATAGAITLGDNGAADTINFGTLTFNTTGGAVSITQDSNMSLTGVNTADSVTLSANGFIQDVSGTSLTVDNGNASFTGSFILLADVDEFYSISGTASFNGGAGIVSVGQGATANTTFGKLTFNTTGGAVTITEDDATILTGTSTGDSLVLVSAGTITDDALTSVTIDNGNASFTGTGITLADNDGDVLSVSLAASFNSGAGSISVGQGSTANVNFGSLTLNGVNATVTEDSSTDFTGSSVLTGFLTLVSNGAITDDANADISVTGAASFSATSADITIGDNGPNNDDTFGSLTLNGANATVVEDDGTDFTGSSTLTGNLTLTSAGAITDQSGVTIDVTDTASFNAGAANITLGDNGGDTIHFGKLLFNTTAGAVTITEDSATIITGPFNTADSLTLISAGSITDDSGVSIVVDAGNASFTGTSIQLADDNGDTLTVSGTASFNAGAGTIVVGVGGTANTMFGKLNFNTTSAGVTVFEDDATILTGVNTGDSLLITSAGSITDDPNTSVTIDSGNAELNGTSISLTDNAGDVFSVANGISALNTTSGPGDITLATAGTVTLGGLTVNGVNATIFADSAASFVGSSTLTGFLSLTTAGDIQDFGPVTISVTGNASFNAVGGQITLGDEASDVVNFGSLTVNGLTANITEDSSTDFTGSSALAGFLTLVSNGAITDDANADISVIGAASFTATGADITLGDNGVNNDDNFGQLTLNGVNATVTEDDSTDFTGASVLTGNLTLFSNGAITDDANADISVTGIASFTATASDITLGDQVGNVDHFGQLTLNGVNATVTEDSGTDFAGSSTLTGFLTLTSAGDITDDATADINVTGIASFTATGGSITLGDQAGNDDNFGQLTLNGVNATVTEDDSTDFTGASVLTGNLTLISNGAITDDADADISVTGIASFTATASDITLGDQVGNVDHFGQLTLNGVNATVTEDSGTDFAGSSTLTGFLTLTSAGDITDDATADINVTGIASFTATGGSITLGDQAGNDDNFGQLTLNGVNATVTEDDSTDFTGASVLSGFLSLVSNGAITDDANADISVTGNASFNAGANAITIGDNGASNDDNFGSVTLNGTAVAVTEDSAMTVAGATATTSLTLSANGTVNQSTAPIVTPTLSVTVTTAGPDDADILLLTQDNDVSGAVTFAEANADALRDVLWRNVSATATWPTLPAAVTINDLTVQHTMTGINITAALALKDLAGDSGDLNLLAGAGAITQNGGATLTIPGTTTLSATGDITLTEANDFDSAGLVAGDGVVTVLKGANVNIRDINSIIIDASDATTGGTMTSFTVTADSGFIFIEDNNLSTTTPVTITTVNNQTYNGNIILEQDTTLISTANGTIAFSGTIDSDTHLGGAARDLTVNTGGLTAFNGATLGATSPLDTLTTDAPGTLNLTGTFNTVQFQLFQDPVTLTGNVINNVAGVGDVTYSQTIDGTFTLAVNTDENTIFGGTIGNTADLVSVTTDAGGTTQINGGLVETTTFQSYGDNVTLGANAVVTSTGGAGDITFGGTVDDDGTAGNAALTVNTGGLTTFTGKVGNTAKLTSVTTDAGGTTRVNGGLAATTGIQVYGDNVTIGAGDAGATTFSSDLTAGNLAIHFTQRVDDDGTVAASNVSINTQGNGRFDGLVGDVAPLTSLTTDAGGETRINPAGAVSGSNADANVYTTGNQTYNDDVKLSVDLAANNGLDVYLKADAGSTIAFGPRVDGRDNFEQGLTVFADSVSITTTQVGILVPLEFLDISAGPSGITTSSLTQNTEIQFLVGTAILGIVEANGFNLTITANDINFVGGANSIRPGAPLGGAGTVGPSLTLRPISTSVAMNIGASADVPATFSLSDADLLALQDGFGGITIGRFDGANPITVHSSNFTDPVRIQAPLAGGTMLIDGLVQSTATPQEALLARDLFLKDINAANNEVFINSYVLGQGGVITGSAGTPLPNGAGILLFGPGSTVTMNANIQTAGTPIVINDGVILNTDVSLNTTFNGVAAGNDITITGTINSAALNNFGVTLRGGTGGNIDIQNTVGNAQALSDIIIPNANNVDFDNAVNITGAITITTANDVIFRNTVVAGGSISIASANNVNFENTVAAGSVTQAAGTGTTVFRDNVTTTTATGVNITSAAITLDGLTINSTAGNGAIRLNGPVTLSTADVTLSAAGGNITFENTVNGGVNLALNSTGITTFNGLVGTGTALTSVTTDAGGTTVINGAGVTTTADQLYNDNVTLGVAAVTLNGVNVTFNGTLDGPAALLVNASGVTTFGDAAGDSVGAGTALLSLTTDAAGSTTINAAIVTTSGAQIYNDALTLGNTVTSTGSTVTFNQTVNAAAAGVQGLAVTGNAVFGDGGADAVGGTAALASLTVSGNTTFNSTAAVDVTTTGNQIYGDNAAIDAITLSADTTLNGASITFNSTIDGAFAFTVNAAATTQFNGVVGSSTPLTSLTTDDFGGAGTFDPTFLNASSFSAGVIAFNDPVGIQVNVTVNGTTSVTFGSSIGSTATEFNDLAINSPTTTFGGPVGTVLGAGGDSLGSLTVSGAVAINGGNINTEAFAGHSGNQSYGGAATIGAGTTLTAGGTLLFSSTLNGAFDLTLAVTGSSTFVGVVGGGTPIGDGTGAAITINSTGATEFQSTVNTASGIIQVGNGTVTFRDNVTIAGTGDTDSNFANSVVLDGLTFTSGDGLVLGSDATDVVTLSGSAVTLAVTGTTTVNAIVNGNQNLTINSTGSTAFNAAVGGTTPATEIGDGTGAAITINAGPVTFVSTVRVKSGITQAGGAGLVTFQDNVTVAAGDTASTFNGNVTLDGLTFTTAKAVTFGDATSDTVTLSTADVTITATSSGADGAVTFNSAVDGAVALTVNTAGATTFNGVVGPNITTLTTDLAGTTTINTATVGGGVIVFNDPVILETSTTVSGTVSVTFGNTLNSAASEANDLTVNSPVTLFAGVVGGAVNGALGTLNTDAAGTTTIDTTAITADEVDFNDAIVLNQSVIVTGTTSVDFASTINSQVGEANSLTVISTTTGFHGIIGALVPLGTLSTDAAGTTTLDTTAITAAVVDFNDAVLVDQNLTINGTTSIDFAGTLDSQAAENNDLTLNSPVTGFHGIVGGTRPLGTLNTDAAGTTTLDTTAITVAVADFNDAVVVDQNLVINGTTSIDFASTLNSQVLENNDLTLNSPTTAFHGIVGAASAFGTLNTDAAGTTTIDTTSVTAANVDFNDAILLTQDVVINGTTTIDFASTVNSSGGARDLTLNSPTTAFHGVVGGNAVLDVLSTDAAGTTTIDTTAISAAVVDFNDAILLTQDVVINGTTSIDFASTVNSGGGARDLTLNSPVTGFHGVVGGSAVLDVLTTDAAGTTTIDTTAINAAVIDFNDAIIIDVGSVLTGTTSVDFALTVDSQVGEANDLTVNSPTTGFHGIVGGTTPLNTLTTDAAGTTTIDTTAITADVVDFNDAILLSQDVVINGTTSVDFASTVNSSGAARDLTVNSPTTAFHGIVGGVTALDVLTTDAAGRTTIDTTAITGATLDFNDAVTLSQNVVLTGTTTVDFATTVDSDLIATPRTLLVVSPLTIFGGSVGGAVPLASLTTDASGAPNLTRINGGSVTTTGDQLYNDTVRLGADTILTGNDITFATLLDSFESALRSLTVVSTGGGITTFNGAVGTLDRLAHLETNADGRTDIAGGLINLNGASALFNDPVLLLADLTINEAGVGSVTFNNTLNGAFNLVVNSDGLGATIFNGVVGGVTPLASITTDADGTTQINGGIVNTSGFQLYNDPVTIGANTVLTSTGVGAAGNITFVTTLDGPFTLLVNTAGTTTFGGPVGSITPLNSVTTDAPGATAINGGSVLTFGIQTYNDPVTLGANTIITSTGAAALGNVTFNSTLDSAVGPFSLVVNTAGNTDFNGAVGGVGALLSLATDAPGTVSIDGGAVTTTTFQLYNDVATIGANTVLTSTGAGNITFMQTLDGAFTLNVNTAGNTVFNGVVGGITPLVSVVTDAPGATQVNGTAVTTTGIQTYNDPVTVGANTLFTSTGVGAAGNITFNSTLDDDAVVGVANVTVNTAGATTFNGAVGGITPLTSLTTDAAGNVAINGGLVTTVNNQTYNDVATLGADTVLNSLAAGNITFAQTLDDDLTIPANTSNLIVNTSGVTTFGGVVGGISPLTSITTDPAVGVVGAGDITAINGGLVITTGFQTYNDNVTVNQDTPLTSTTVGDITIGQPNPPVPWGLTTLMGTVPGVDMIINALGGNVQINAAVSGVDTLNGIATATYIAANPGNTGINLYLSTPNSPFVFIYTAPPVSFNLNNKVYSMEEIFGRDVPNLFKYPGDDKSVSSDISVLLTTNRVETLIGSLPTDKITTSYDLAALEEARKNR